jgi:hypothetical protein
MSARFTTREGCSFDHNLTGCRQASERDVMDRARTEAREPDAELMRMIERRTRKGEVDPDELDAGYMESVRGYEEKRRQAPRGAAAKLMDVRPKGA